MRGRDVKGFLCCTAKHSLLSLSLLLPRGNHKFMDEFEGEGSPTFELLRERPSKWEWEEWGGREEREQLPESSQQAALP